MTAMSRKPKKARILHGKSAWWYDEHGAISVHIEGLGSVLSCQIKRSALQRYMKRSMREP